MLTRIADGVHVHESSCLQTNGIVAEGPSGALVVDPGLTRDELACLAEDLRALNTTVAAGFSTHPDWDHVLWHPALGDAPRYATARAAERLSDLLVQDDWEAQVAEGLPPEIADDVPMELLGLVTPLPAGTTEVPWDGPRVRILEHRGHAPGHAALLVEDRGVLIAGDMLSDVLVPMLDLHGSADAVADYLDALRMFDGIAGSVEVVVPGHGSVGGAGELRERLDRDTAYVEALRDGRDARDPRITEPREGWEWVSYIHEGQLEALPGRNASNE